MTATHNSPMATSSKGVSVRRPKKLNRHRRVTTEMVTAARRAVRKANEEALKRRLQGARSR